MITRDEIRAHMEAMMKERRAKMFDRMDANHDGMISKDEMETAMHDIRGTHGGHMMDMGRMMDGGAMGDDAMPPAR